MKRIGILGGTFDPPHLGHLLIADEVRYIARLDEVWFIPTNEPPHKHKATTNSTHRYDMLVQAIKGIYYFKVDAIELNRHGKSYTIDTVNELTERHPTYSFYFIIGADMVEYLPKWNQIDQLVKKIQFIGVKRPSYKLKTNYPVKTINIPLLDISSTDIKKRIQEKAPYQFFLPQDVYTYIKEHRLYEF